MTRRQKHDIPGIDWRVSVAEVRERGWPAIFGADVPKPLPLTLEIGFGRGEFLLAQAEAAPATPFVGIEVSGKRALKMARRLAKTPLHNVRLVEATAQEVFAEALPDASLDCVWINYPDPWPKKRHFKRRLIQPAFVALLVRRLTPGGRLRIATDHPGYAEWIHEVLSGTPELSNAYAPDAFRSEVPGRMATAYERAWRAEGRSLHYFEYVRRRAAS